MKIVCKDVFDVLDLDNSILIGGGGVGDVYGEDVVIEDQMFIFWIWVVVRYDFFIYSLFLLFFFVKIFVFFVI